MTAKFLSEGELAQRWLRSKRTLQRMRQNGCGPTFLRIGRRILYLEQDVEIYEAAARRDSGSAE